MIRDTILIDWYGGIAMFEEDNNTYQYFVAFVENRTKLTVIDLSSAVSYERNDWDVVNDEVFYDRDEAIKYARALAKKYNLEYKLFDSRYNSELSERLTLTLDDDFEAKPCQSCGEPADRMKWSHRNQHFKCPVCDTTQTHPDSLSDI